MVANRRMYDDTHFGLRDAACWVPAKQAARVRFGRWNQMRISKIIHHMRLA